MNQITFGYVVDSDETVARSNGDGSVTVQGSAIAERILLTTTPNTVYGDSIKGNKTWAQRDLPKPTPEDRFKGRGTFATNLYREPKCWGHCMVSRPCSSASCDASVMVMPTAPSW